MSRDNGDDDDGGGDDDDDGGDDDDDGMEMIMMKVARMSVINIQLGLFINLKTTVGELPI